MIEDGDNVIGANTAGPSSSLAVKGDVTRGASGRKKVKGPNPLSVRRKKTETGQKRPRDETSTTLEEGQGQNGGEGGDVSMNGETVKENAGEAGHGDGDGEGGKRRKKRKRGKGKSAVAEARAELMGELQAARSGVLDNDNGGESEGGGSDDE